MDIIYLIAGILLLAFGGELLIRGALSVAKRAGISPLFSGLVIVGFGTSSPELAVSLDAALNSRPDITVGNVVGSNISNILLILGISAMISPIAVKPTALRRDGVVALGAAALFVLLVLGGTISRAEGIFLMAALTVYLVLAYRGERTKHGADAEIHEKEAELVEAVPGSITGMLAGVAGGLVLLIGGSQLLLTGATGIAEAFGVSEAVIGLTVVAAGTSLPELTICVIAAFRNQADVAIGNVLGSNIFNILGILGISALASPLGVHSRIILFDQWVMAGVTLLLLVFLYSGRRLSRTEGGMLFLLYLGYVVMSFTLPGGGS